MDFGQQFWLFVRKVKSEVRNEPEKFEKALAHLPIDTVQQMKSIYIPPYKIDRTGPLLGSGQFGQVMKGTFGTATVCIKSTKIESAAHNPGLAEQLSKDIFKEAVHMKEMEHENVMHLLGSHFRSNFRFSSNSGVTMDENGNAELILPMMELGDLKSFLQDDTARISHKEALKFSCQIAAGMEYLHTQNIIHRDLAARNCLLGQDYPG